MKSLLIIFLLFLSSCYQVTAPACPADVYICNNGVTEVYHSNINCTALRQCKHEILILDLEKAKENYRQCEVCN